MIGDIGIGEVVVHRGEPPRSTPYGRPSLIGDHRVEALTAWANGGDTAAWTFWCAPGSGGAFRLNDPDKVNWDTSGIERRHG